MAKPAAGRECKVTPDKALEKISRICGLGRGGSEAWIVVRSSQLGAGGWVVKGLEERTKAQPEKGGNWGGCSSFAAMGRCVEVWCLRFEVTSSSGHVSDALLWGWQGAWVKGRDSASLSRRGLAGWGGMEYGGGSSELCFSTPCKSTNVKSWKPYWGCRVWWDGRCACARRPSTATTTLSMIWLTWSSPAGGS